jgi:1-aminocyclopropane-1-carboxylate synthase
MSLGIVSDDDCRLSTRAQQAAIAESKNLIFDILNDLWDPQSNPNGFFNVGVAENSLMHDVLLEQINKQLDLPAKYLTYNEGGDGSTRLKMAISRFLNRHFVPVTPIQPSHLIVTNGVSSAIEHLSWAFADPSEGILLGKPFYGQFIPDLALRPGTEVVQVNFNGRDPLGSAAVENYERALQHFQSRTGNKVKALVLCHPHNPLGRCYPKETIIELMRLCQKYHMHLISDEIYGLSTWDNHIDTCPAPSKFRSVLSIDTEGIIDPRLIHAIWGMSKDFGANGIRVGVIISQANTDLENSLSGPSLYSYVSGLSDYIAANILEDDSFADRYIEANREKLEISYHFVVKILRDHGIEYAPGSNAGFFVWVNLGKKYLENRQITKYEGLDMTQDIMERLLERKVFLASGNAFGSEEPGWFRIMTAQPLEYLKEALRRIEIAISG